MICKEYLAALSPSWESRASYAECLATASGVAAECYGKTVRDDEGSHIQGRYGYDSRAQIR